MRNFFVSELFSRFLFYSKFYPVQDSRGTEGRVWLIKWSWWMKCVGWVKCWVSEVKFMRIFQWMKTFLINSIWNLNFYEGLLKRFRPTYFPKFDQITKQYFWKYFLVQAKNFSAISRTSTRTPTSNSDGNTYFSHDASHFLAWV